mmetsp:Transcript_14105/g.33798  ORF Transcript_14105/g.33798 Transcript_14105/m.33798 type:complete len:323 (+) Transcript_14105:134-1102(+)
MSGKIDNRQQRKQQRRRIRTYMASVNSLPTDDFHRQTRSDLKAAVMRSCISDAVMVARTIFKKERSTEWNNNNNNCSALSSSSGQQSTRTEGQELSRILSGVGNDTETPLQWALDSGATLMAHFILSLNILFQLDEQSIQNEAHTMMFWLHKDKNLETLWKEELIMTIKGGPFRYLYDQQFTIQSLVDFALPHLSPHTKLEKYVAFVGEQVARLSSSHDHPPGSNVSSMLEEEEKGHRCSEDHHDGQTTTATEKYLKQPAQQPPKVDCETSAILVNYAGGEDCIDFDGDDCSDAGFSFVRNDSINEENEWEVVSAVSSILSF